MLTSFPRLASCFIGGLALSFTPSVSNAGDVDPTGSISTDRDVVLANSTVNVTWQANYPAPIFDLVERKTDTSLTSRIPLRVDVRVIGAAFGPVTKPYPVCGWVKTSVGTTTWTQIFLGNCNTYNPQTVVWSKVLAANERIDFKFQGSLDNTYVLSNPSTIGSWQQPIDTTASSKYPWNRAVYVDGETTPNYNAAFDQGDVHAHLKAYFYPGTTKLKLAPRDFIYLTELSNFAKGDKSTDMQDLVLLVTFEELPPVETSKTTTDTNTVTTTLTKTVTTTVTTTDLVTGITTVTVTKTITDLSTGKVTTQIL
jgi:hypothetical protein